MKRKMAFILAMLMLFGIAPQLASASQDAPREIVSLDGQWRFIGSNSLTGAGGTDCDDSAWEIVSVPHTWATYENRTRYSNAWYRRTFFISAQDSGRRLYLQFDGVMSVADVYINGNHIGKHKGGYTAFNYDITDCVNYGADNTLAVMVSNADKDIRDSLPANHGLYTQWGGIYRSVRLIKTGKYHIDPSDYASSGVYLSAANVSESGADISARVMLRNAGTEKKTFTVKAAYTGPDGSTALLEGTKEVEPAQASITYSPNWDLYSESAEAAAAGGFDKYSVMESKNEAANYARFSSYGKEYAVLRFRGTAVSMYALKLPKNGIADIELDGKAVASVDLYSPEPRGAGIVWSASGLRDGLHTVRIINSNTANPSSSASAENGYFINIAGFDITNGRGVSAHINATNKTFIDLSGHIASPKLWSVDSPNLYRVRVELWSDGVLCDAVEERTGFRTFEISSDNVLLNGKQELLRGASYHQELEYCASVMTEEDFDKNLYEMKELGMNFVRFAHYPRAKYEYGKADEIGLLAWAENGNTSTQWTGDYDNFAWYNQRRIMRELIRQNYNHPSIVFWSAGNESDNSTNTNNALYAVAKQEDPSRHVSYAFAWGSGAASTMPGDLVNAYNIYPGWYGSSFQNFPSGVRFISESGAGGVRTTHNDYNAVAWSVDKWEPEEYQQICLEYQLQYVFKTNPTGVPLYSIWNLNDFADTKYKGMINSKGLHTYAGERKDICYLFRAFAKEGANVLHIVGKNWFLREEIGNGIKVYSNSAGVTLTVNGESKGRLANGSYALPGGTKVNNVFYWDGVLQNGKNVIVATDDEGNTDSAVIYFSGDAKPAPAESGLPVKDLKSTNASNTPVYIDTPVKSEQPLYYQSSSDNAAKYANADNTFCTLPEILAEARLIATKRQSDSRYSSGLSFEMTENAVVYVLATDKGGDPSWITDAGFENTGVTGVWRNNSLRRENYKIYSKECAPGEFVSLSGDVIDYAVLIKPLGDSIAIKKPAFLQNVFSSSGAWYLAADVAYSAAIEPYDKNHSIEITGDIPFTYDPLTRTLSITAGSALDGGTITLNVTVSDGRTSRIIPLELKVFSSAESLVKLIAPDYGEDKRYTKASKAAFLAAVENLKREAQASKTSEEFVAAARAVKEAYDGLESLDLYDELDDGTVVIDIPKTAKIYTANGASGLEAYALLTDNNGSTAPSLVGAKSSNLNGWMIFDFGEGFGARISEVRLKVLASDAQKAAGTALAASNDGYMWKDLTDPAASSSDWQAFSSKDDDNTYRFLKLYNKTNPSWGGKVSELRLIGFYDENDAGVKGRKFSSASFDYTLLDRAYTDIFTCEYDIVPFSDKIDGIVTFAGSNTIPSQWSSYNITIRLNTDGYFDARNKDVFTALNKVPYSAGQSYHVTAVIDVKRAKYGVYVNGTPIAQDFAFRHDAPAVTDIDKYTIRGGFEVDGFGFCVDNFKSYDSSKISLSYDGRAARLVSPEALSAKLILAVYRNNRLTCTAFTDVSLRANIEGAYEIKPDTAESGDTARLFLWDSFESARPLIESLEVIKE